MQIVVRHLSIINLFSSHCRPRVPLKVAIFTLGSHCRSFSRTGAVYFASYFRLIAWHDLISLKTEMFSLIHATHGWRVLGVLNIYEWNEYFRWSVVVGRRHWQTGNHCTGIPSHNSKRFAFVLINMHQAMDTTVFAFFFFFLSTMIGNGETMLTCVGTISAHIYVSVNYFVSSFGFVFTQFLVRRRMGVCPCPACTIPESIVNRWSCEIGYVRCFVHCHRHNQLLIDRIKACSQQSNISLSSLIL